MNFTLTLIWILAILKMCDLLPISWLVVFAPLLVLLGIITVAVVIAVFACLIDEWWS